MSNRSTVRTGRLSSRDSPTWSELVGDAYECAFSPEMWPHFVEQLSRRLRSIGTGLAVGGPRGRWQAYALVDQRWAESYEQRYGEALVERALDRALIGRALDVSQLESGPMDRWEFCADWMRPQRYREGIGGYTDLGDGQLLGIGTYRSFGSPGFEAEDHALLEALLPHLKRAVEIGARVRLGEIQLRSAESILERVAVGLVLLDDEGCVVAANDVARAIARQNDGLELSSAGLRVSDRGTQARLDEQIRGAIRAPQERGEAPGRLMRIPRRSSGLGYEICIGPAPGGALWGDPRRPAVLVLVREIDTRVSPDARALEELYGMTAAEAKVSAGIARGCSVDELATAAGLSRRTIGNQLAAAFDKTDTHRQAELAALLQSSLASLASVEPETEPERGATPPEAPPSGALPGNRQRG